MFGCGGPVASTDGGTHDAGVIDAAAHLDAGPDASAGDPLVGSWLENGTSGLADGIAAPIEYTFHADHSAEVSVTVHHGGTDAVRPGCTVISVQSGIAWTDTPTMLTIDSTAAAPPTATASGCTNASDNGDVPATSGSPMTAFTVDYAIAGDVLTLSSASGSVTFTRR